MAGATVELERKDKLQIALDKLFGISHEFTRVREGRMEHLVKGEPLESSVPAFSGIREAYTEITGDRELQWTPGAGRVTEEWNAAGFATALANTLHRRMVQDYADPFDQYGLDLICPPREPHRIALKDFRTHEIVRVGYLSDLPLNDPEQQDWDELDAPTDEKAQLAAVQFGGIISVTRKTVINDDIDLVGKIAGRAGRAARRTLAKRLWNLAINNGAIYDGVNFFHGGHNNLGSTALTADANGATEVQALWAAMFAQTEKDSGAPLGLVPSIIAVPGALYFAAKTLNETERFTNFAPNPVQHLFGEKNEGIIKNPLFTDTNDWYAFADPDSVQTFEIGFLQGKAEPELLLADNQLVGKAFISDRIQYKIRHEYEVTVVDYRGAYKEAVA